MNMQNNLNEIKRKIRKLKQAELKIRSQGADKPNPPLVWDEFFDLRERPAGKAPYTLSALAAMSRDEYDGMIEEYFSRVYYLLYRENGMAPGRIFDAEALGRLGLPLYADENDIKKKFRELAKLHHPDAGGDADIFIKFLDAYKELIEA